VQSRQIRRPGLIYRDRLRSSLLSPAAPPTTSTTANTIAAIAPVVYALPPVEAVLPSRTTRIAAPHKTATKLTITFQRRIAK